MCYLLGESGVHKTDTDSNLAPVLNLRSVSKCLKVSSSRPTVTCLGSVNLQGGVSGSHQDEASEVYQAKQIKIWPCWGRTLYRNCGASWVTQRKMVLF